MTQPKSSSDPIAALQQLAATEAARRAEQRASNRARFPEFAAMTDTGMWKLVHAQDADGEIGKIPPLPPGCVWIDWTERSLIEDWPVFMAAGKGKRRA